MLVLFKSEEISSDVSKVSYLWEVWSIHRDERLFDIFCTP